MDPSQKKKPSNVQHTEYRNTGVLRNQEEHKSEAWLEYATQLHIFNF